MQSKMKQLSSGDYCCQEPVSSSLTRICFGLYLTCFTSYFISVNHLRYYSKRGQQQNIATFRILKGKSTDDQISTEDNFIFSLNESIGKMDEDNNPFFSLSGLDKLNFEALIKKYVKGF